ncbi:hypothetical protein [Metabacillus fastidiosus]|uniref:hypothetical protein n=1 Tax=Metabacillus fastidiosus TaxID=1458 RepID=UPI003D2B56F1
MFQRITIATCTLFFIFIVATTLEAKALSFNELPVKQTSKQWSVQVDEAEKGEDLAKPEKGKFHTYSLKVNNIGKDVSTVEIYLFRNEPNSTTKFSLSGCPDNHPCRKLDPYKMAISLAKQLNDGASYQYSNFVLAEKATELEIEVIWTENSEGRPLKERFTFTSD